MMWVGGGDKRLLGHVLQLVSRSRTHFVLLLLVDQSVLTLNTKHCGEVLTLNT